MTIRKIARYPSSLLAFALLLSAPGVALAAGEITGRVAGYVYDPAGEPLAEVPLTLSGPALQQPMTTTSNANGRYEFVNVPPGEGFVLEVNVPGFAPIRQTGITVLLGKSSAVDARLSVLTETQAVQTYEIVAKVNPIVNPDSAQTGAVITAEKAVQTPTFQQVQGMPQQVAGVGPGNRPSTRGGLERYGKFYVDGMDTTDITDGSITAPLNFQAVENFEVVTGGLDAQYNSLGMVQNVVTKTGSNKITYDVNLILAPDFLTARNKTPSSQPPMAHTYVNNDQPGPLTSFYSPAVNVGGPIIKDKLWFYVSGQTNFSNRETPITIGSLSENRNTRTLTMLGRLKLTYQATEKDRVSVALNLDRNTIDNSIGNSSVTEDAESRIDRGGYFLIVNYDRNITDNLLFQLQTGTTYKDVNFDPQKNSDEPSHRDLNTGVTSINAGSLSAVNQGNFLHEKKRRIQFDPTVIWRLGAHQIKGGVQVTLMSSDQETGVRGNQRYFDRGGVCNPDDPATHAYCNQRVDFYNLDNKQEPLRTKANVQTYGFFLQDRWHVNRNLTAIPGIRADVGRLSDYTGAAVATLVGVGPRLALTYDLRGDRKDLVVANYGRSNDVGDVFVAQQSNPTLLQVTSRWTGNAFPACDPNNILPQCSLSGGLSGRQFAGGTRPPFVDEVSGGYRHALDNGLVLGTDVTYRHYGNLWAFEEINRIYDPSGTQIVGYVNGQPQSILEARTPRSAYRRYGGLDLWAQGSYGPWDVLGSYTLAYNWGTVSEYFDGYLNNPRISQFYEGWLPDDYRHTIKGSIGFNSGHGWDLGMRLQYRTGNPLWESFTNPADSSQRYYRSPRGTGFANNTSTGLPDFNDPSSWVELRNPDQFNIDLQARYDVGRLVNLQQRVELALLVVNVLNPTGPRTYSDQYSSARNSRYGTTASRFAPFQAELILRVRN